MPPIVIDVQNVSKRYIISHRASYDTFRDSLVDAAKKPFRLLTRKPRPTKEEFWALHDVSFQVHQGDRVGIIGRNGAGKSTMLKILSQITGPTTGQISMTGRIASLLEVGTGFHPELTGRENVYLNGAILGMKQSEIRKKFDEIVAFSEIEKFLDTPVKRYSSGMYVRLAFAVAAHLDPEILIVDEVLAVGDQQFQKKCLGKMEDFTKTGRTVLFVSHNMSAINRLCSRTVLLDQGRVVTSGNTDMVIKKYIEQGMIERPEFHLPPDPSKPIHLRSVTVMNAGGQVTADFRFDEEIYIQIEYEVNQPVDDCKVWYGLRTTEEVHVYGSADTDMSEPLQGRRKPGRYITKTKIPKCWLNSGRYYLVVGVVRSSTVTSFDREEITSISVLDIGVPEVGRPGMLQPYLEWQTTASDKQ